MVAGTSLIYTKNRAIGLLGGSFNPAHEGHLHISLHALKSLHLDEVWWLVSPQNPLKSKSDMAAYEMRLASAKAMVAGNRRIRVLDIEQQKQLYFSWQTVQFLQRRFRGTYFVWMMGADNLAQFHRWHRWAWMMQVLPLAVFDRAPHSHSSLRGKTFNRARKLLYKNNKISKSKPQAAMVFCHLRRMLISSTQLRKMLGEQAFLRHNKGVGK